MGEEMEWSDWRLAQPQTYSSDIAASLRSTSDRPKSVPTGRPWPVPFQSAISWRACRRDGSWMLRLTGSFGPPLQLAWS